MSAQFEKVILSANAVPAKDLLPDIHHQTLDLELVAAVESIAQLVQETVELTDGLYQPRYPLPK